VKTKEMTMRTMSKSKPFDHALRELTKAPLIALATLFLFIICLAILAIVETVGIKTWPSCSK